MYIIQTHVKDCFRIPVLGDGLSSLNTRLKLAKKIATSKIQVLAKGGNLAVLKYMSNPQNCP